MYASTRSVVCSGSSGDIQGFVLEGPRAFGTRSDCGRTDSGIKISQSCMLWVVFILRFKVGLLIMTLDLDFAFLQISTLPTVTRL